MGRFINADKFAATGQGILGANMFAYCLNNPINRIDRSGHRPQWVEAVVDWLEDAFKTVVSFVRQAVDRILNTLQALSQSKPGRLPTTGEPGSSKTLPGPNGIPKQKRWYGPDGKPERDRDYDHPGSMPFPHDHDWENGQRGAEHLPPSPDYEISFQPVIGIALVAVCIIGIVVVAADDSTGVGVADDYFFVPLIEGLREGLIMAVG